MSVLDFGADPTGTMPSDAAFSSAIASLPVDACGNDLGGTVLVPPGKYTLSAPLVIARKNVRLLGSSRTGSYIERYQPTIPPGVMVKTSFPWVATVSIEADEVEVAELKIRAPGGSTGAAIAVRGAGAVRIHDNWLASSAPATGWGIALSDKDAAGNFVPGSYRHRISNNRIGEDHFGFARGITTIDGDCTGTGMNALVIDRNHVVSNQAVVLAYGGGNLVQANLLQSETGGNSGAAPFTGGVGKAISFGGELHAMGNYAERYEHDFWQLSSSAKYSVVDHHSDASNHVFAFQPGYPAPSFVVTGDGVLYDARHDDSYEHPFTANGETMPVLASVQTISGNGSARTNARLAPGSRLGQRLTLVGLSWPVTFAADAAVWGNAGAPTLGNASGQAVTLDLVFTRSGWAEVSRTIRP